MSWLMLLTRAPCIMPPSILDLSDPNVPLPGFILVDASILLMVRSLPGVPPSPRQAAATHFLTRIQNAYCVGDTIPLVCPLTLEECYFKIIRWKYENDPALGGGQWHQLYKNHPQQIRNYLSDIQAFYTWIIGIPFTIIEPEDLVTQGTSLSPIEDRMRHYSDSCCILPKDACLVAVADRLGITHIASLDRDFERLDATFTVYMLP
jgi:hypothetical protein